jgi:type I restriction enzyme S subunit
MNSVSTGDICITFFALQNLRSNGKFARTRPTWRYVSLTAQRELVVRLPEISTQRAIASLLGALDDKIELNQRMNRTLEELASTLFKSWFVDFEPVQAKRDGRKPVGVPEAALSLFPEHFVDVGADAIPRGWRPRRLRDLIAGLFDGPHATPPPATTGGIFLGIRNLPGTRIDLSEVRYIAESDWTRWTRRVVPCEGDIVFTYEAAIGRFAVVPPNLQCCLGRRVALVRPSRRQDTEYLFFSFISEAFQDLLAARSNTGSTVDRIPLEDFPSYEILWPGEELVDLFSSLVAPMRCNADLNNAQNQQIATLRNAVLGPLLSGELTIQQTEKAVAEVA